MTGRLLAWAALGLGIGCASPDPADPPARRPLSGCEAQWWWVDEDGDGFGAAPFAQGCTAPAAFTVSESGDCDDLDATVHPEAPERCDRLDQDCDGVADNDVVEQVPLYLDQDRDGFGGRLVSSTCEPDFGPRSTPRTPVPGDCDDGDPSRNPGVDEARTCDGLDSDCDGVVSDAAVLVNGVGADSLQAALESTGRPASLVLDVQFCRGGEHRWPGPVEGVRALTVRGMARGERVRLVGPDGPMLRAPPDVPVQGVGLSDLDLVLSEPAVEGVIAGPFELTGLRIEGGWDGPSPAFEVEVLPAADRRQPLTAVVVRDTTVALEAPRAALLELGGQDLGEGVWSRATVDLSLDGAALAELVRLTGRPGDLELAVDGEATVGRAVLSGWAAPDAVWLRDVPEAGGAPWVDLGAFDPLALHLAGVRSVGQATDAEGLVLLDAPEVALTLEGVRLTDHAAERGVVAVRAPELSLTLEQADFGGDDAPNTPADAAWFDGEKWTARRFGAVSDRLVCRDGLAGCSDP